MAASFAHAQSADEPTITGGPTADEVEAAYPAKARDEDIQGAVIMACATTAQGGLKDCVAQSESPEGYGFGAAALSLANRFKVSVEPDAAQTTIRIPIMLRGSARLSYKASPTSAQLQAARPEGVDSFGAVLLRCVAAASGRFKTCTVAGEDPVGVGFGEAAVKVSGLYRFEAKDRAGRPVADRAFVFGVGFRAPGETNPNWLRKPSAEQLQAAFPVRAAKEGKDGSALIGCQVTIEGYLDRCTVVAETPADYGFGQAALHLAQHFAMKPRIRDGKPVGGGTVRIPIMWKGYAASDLVVSRERLLLDPNWSRTPTAAAVKAAYPAKAADVASGQAVARCRFDEAGRTRGCTVLSEAPIGKGFGGAARALATQFTGQFTAEDAENLRFYSVDIPFRFRNPAAPDNAPLTQVRWTRVLSADGAARLFPEAAAKAKVLNGMGMVNCAAGATGELTDCRIESETPAALGFGASAMEAAKLMQMNPWTKSGDAVEGRRLSVPIRFKLEDPAPAAPPPKS